VKVDWRTVSVLVGLQEKVGLGGPQSETEAAGATVVVAARALNNVVSTSELANHTWVYSPLMKRQQ
jgi:hypothetical protein